jgi:hypothetical protein
MPVLDIDLTVADPSDEAAYVAALPHAKFVLRIREPSLSTAVFKATIPAPTCTSSAPAVPK